MFWIIALLALQWGLESMSIDEIGAPTSVMPKIRAAERQEVEWINNCYDQVEFIHSHFENEIIAIAEFNGEKAGLGRLVKVDENNLELGGMYVFESFREKG